MARFKTLPVLLQEGVPFPDPDRADRGGLVAVGGALSTERLLEAYRSGIFPWSAAPVTWWSPDPRAIIETGQLHVPRSLMKFIHKRPFDITTNHAFAEVMRRCAEPRHGQPHSWITAEFIKAYTELHRLGHAHSLECWQARELVGGIYGVATGGFFAGESMFHRVSNASKVALFHLAERLAAQGFVLFDVQMLTPVTQQMGGIEIPRTIYLKRLAQAVRLSKSF
jgi:leucyl/phenylalanyl-tRNA--protein transferase